MQGCRGEGMRGCGDAGMRGCRGAGMQECVDDLCRDARARGCGDEGMQGCGDEQCGDERCGDARMRGCGDEGMISTGMQGREDAGMQGRGDAGVRGCRPTDGERAKRKHPPAKSAGGNTTFPFPLAPSLLASPLLPFTRFEAEGGGREAALKGATSKPAPQIPYFGSGCSHTPGPRPLAPLPFPFPDRINRHFPKSNPEFVKSCVTVDLLTVSTFFRHEHNPVL